MPPAYGSRAYWEQRFTQEREFEWLLPPDALLPAVRRVIAKCDAACPKILHIGCGSSKLSFHLRILVEKAMQVTNVDYSEVAIRNCVEQESTHSSGAAKGDVMAWRAMDLLCADSIATLKDEDDVAGAGGMFDVIVDKSTSDCIACSNDVKIALPHRLRRDADSQPHSGALSCYLHPLHVVAVHLAALARPGVARWICLSYTDDRFPFLGSGWHTSASTTVDVKAIEDGFPDPRTLWRIEHKQQLVVEKAPCDNDDERPYVHRPTTCHWLYVLVRTETPL